MTAAAHDHRHPPHAGGVRRCLGALWRALVAWHRAAVRRRALAELDPRILADIGIDRAGVRLDADRPRGADLAAGEFGSTGRR